LRGEQAECIDLTQIVNEDLHQEKLNLRLKHVKQNQGDLRIVLEQQNANLKLKQVKLEQKDLRKSTINKI
jgi:hypothetical protein